MQHVDGGGFGGATANEFQRFWCINRGRRIGARYHGCHTTRRGGGACGFIAFFVTLAWFGNFDADIDQTGCKIFTVTVDYGVCCGGRFDNRSIANHHIALRYGAGLGVNDLRIFEK